MHFIGFMAALPVLLAIFSGVQATPVASGTDEPTDCVPMGVLARRSFLDAELEGRAPKFAATTEIFLKYLKDNTKSFVKAPVFWNGKFGRKGAKGAADILKKDTSKVGPKGGWTVFDAVAQAKISTAGWKPNPDWKRACGDFAVYSKPATGKAHHVQGPEVEADQSKNIWINDEWPALEANPDVKEVEVHKMKDGGTSFEDPIEIKKSKKGPKV